MTAPRNLALVVCLAWALPSPGAAACARADLDDRIAFESARIERDPRLFPAYTALAGAFLEKARLTGDPAWLREARAALGSSMEIQPTYEAMVLAASVSSYAHRFVDALEWIDRAAAGSPAGDADPLLVSMRIESLLALGRTSEAGRLLPPPRDDGETGYHVSVARGQWSKAAGRDAEALEAFSAAAAAARRKQAPQLEAWAEIAVAGVLIDAGSPQRARPHLDRARALDPCRTDLAIHEAEWQEATGHPGEALAILEQVLSVSDDPAVAHQGFLLARRLGELESARGLYERASAGYRRAIDAGEVYTVGAMERLARDAAATKLQPPGG